jgi:membrane protein implicated in regulation of membrane protease activity
VVTVIAVQIKRPFAETADHRTRLGKRPLKSLLQQFFVDFHQVVAEAGAAKIGGSAWRHHRSGRDFQIDGG